MFYCYKLQKDSDLVLVILDKNHWLTRIRNRDDDL